MIPLTALGVLYLALGAPELVANASFEAGSAPMRGVGYLSQGNTIDGWEATGEVARNERGVAFFDNGLAVGGTHVVALQNRATLRQEVGPFERDRVYRLRVWANGRASDLAGYQRFGQLQVTLNGTTLLPPSPVRAVDAAGAHLTPFAVREALFVPGDGRYLLELSQVDPAEGISVLIDGVSIEPVDAPVDGAVLVNRARPRAASDPVREIDFRRVNWIWSAERTDPREAAPVGRRYFRQAFTVASLAEVKRAFFVVSADNEATVHINGVYRGGASSFGDWYEVDLLDALRAGRNVIAIEAYNGGAEPNPAGLAGALLLLGEGGKLLQALVTDDSWRVSAVEVRGWRELETSDSAWPQAVRLGAAGCSPWGTRGFLTWLVPTDFPRFEVPGQERYTELLSQLFWLHHAGSGPKATMWDAWLAASSLWPAVGDAPGASGFAQTWRSELLGRPMDAEGYVSTIQHHGFGHGEGWPFPTTFQAGGVAWQFASEHTAYRVAPTTSLDGWTLDGLEQTQLDSTQGLSLRVTAATASLTTPSFDVDRGVAPFARLEWVPDCPAGSKATLAWTTSVQPGFSAERAMPLPLAPDMPGRTYTHVPLYRHADQEGRLTRLRLSFEGARGGTLRILGLITAADTRHPVNNPTFLQGCTEYYRWTGDQAFLTANLARMRRALDFALREFAVAREGSVLVPWVGHDGRSGLGRTADGAKTVHAGRGIGCNYWDLLPFGGHDCLATIYLYDALGRMAQLEATIAAHPEWRLPAPDRSARQLADLADLVRRRAGQRFWNPTTGRFAACVDSDGVAHDYGYTFVNAEAIYYGLASPEQARSIVAWLDGQRTVAGDTAVGDDIYHWRFGPRASTRRNTDWYSFVWSAPESIPWGGQVQDGGAVLGFAYHDQMARLRTVGPDNAWAALRRTLDWFAEVRAEGGYRAYYAKPGRGTLQGGGPAGGLGMDQEFFESVLVPQIMLYGFLGFQPTPDGFRLAPSLPRDWPSLRITRIAWRDTVLDITVGPRELTITCAGGRRQQARIGLPPGWTGIGAVAEIGDVVVLTARRP